MFLKGTLSNRAATREFLADFLMRKHLYKHSSVYVGFVVNKVAVSGISRLVLQFCPVSIIPPLLHTHSFIYMLLFPERRNDHLWGSFRRATLFRKSRSIGYKSTSSVFRLQILNVTMCVCVYVLQDAGSYPVHLVQTEALAFGAKCGGSHFIAPTNGWTDTILPSVCGTKRYRPNFSTVHL
jgi:hypothetical protein